MAQNDYEGKANEGTFTTAGNDGCDLATVRGVQAATAGLPWGCEGGRGDWRMRTAGLLCIACERQLKRYHERRKGDTIRTSIVRKARICKAVLPLIVAAS